MVVLNGILAFAALGGIVGAVVASVMKQSWLLGGWFQAAVGALVGSGIGFFVGIVPVCFAPVRKAFAEVEALYYFPTVLFAVAIFIGFLAVIS